MRRALLALLGWLFLTDTLVAFPNTYDTDASVYFLQLSINGCATPSASFKAAVNAYIIAEKAALNWGNQDAQYLLATTDACTAGTNLAQPTLYGVTWNGSPTFTVQNGLPGDGSTQDGDTNVNLSALTRLSQNNAHLESWVAANKGDGLGLIGTTNGFVISAVTNKITKLNTNVSITDTGGGTAGLHYADRVSSSTTTTGLNGVVQSNAVASTSGSPIVAHPGICIFSAVFCPAGTNELFVGFGSAMNNESAHYTDVRNLLLALGVTGI